ncbi:MAG: zinc-ribbon domain-containing protein, partial [Rhodococcus sp.]|nr:zinc-ribbon domain-containing protein [Rhodococcus sp. (in: high G+C Gram-positive bacteria)]
MPLSVSHPLVAAQWHPLRNDGLTPSEVTAGSDRKVWWVDRLGHEWQATVSNRTARHSGCPYCSNRKVLVGFNDLASHAPDLADQWHPTKNGDLRPDSVLFRSARRSWWQDELGHEWQAEVRERVRGTTCPFCACRRVLVGFNDLASQCPSLAEQWHPVRNGELTPETVSARSSRRVWWLGKCEHEWQATIASRHIANCPYCSGRRPVSGVSDLETVSPQLAAQWHLTRNGDLTPEDVSAGSKRLVWWRDDSGHEWQSTVKDRTAGHHCPYCSGRLPIRGETDLESQFPKVASEWHPTKNDGLRPSEVTFGSSRRVWWLGSCGHEWMTAVTYRTGNDRTGCPVCVVRWSRAEK